MRVFKILRVRPAASDTLLTCAASLHAYAGYGTGFNAAFAILHANRGRALLAVLLVLAGGDWEVSGLVNVALELLTPGVALLTALPSSSNARSCGQHVNGWRPLLRRSRKF